MRIAGLLLRGFEPFRDSGIAELDITFNEDVQIVIGTNGSGKSVFMRQLSTYPQVRKMFDKKGHKALVIEDDGVYYKLETEYEKPSSPHLFFKGDSEENLNVGRTTEGQRDLIIEHLGITPLVDDLIMNRYVFPSWTAANRKQFLMNANPDQIGFVLTHIKNIASKIKACKNNLARLQSRKILLEQDLLSDERLTELQQEKDQISQDLAGFQQTLMDLEVGLRTIGQRPATFSLTNLESVRKTVTRSYHRLAYLGHVNRDDYQRQQDREHYLSSLAVLDLRLTETDEKILAQSSELHDLEVRYRELTFDCDLKSVDDTIQRLEDEQLKLQTHRPTFELSQEELDQKYHELDEVDNVLQFFTKLDVKLLSSKKRQQRETKLHQAQHKQSSYNMRLSDLRNQKEDLDKRHTIQPSDIPDSPCAKERCPLYNHFMGRFETTESQRQSVLRSIAKGERKLVRLDRYISASVSYFQQSRVYYDKIQWLLRYAQSNPVLHQLLRQMDVLAVLSTNPNRISRQLRDAYDQLNQWIKLKSVQSDLETAYALRSRQISTESHDTIKLVSSIDELKASLQRLREAIVTITDDKKTIGQKLDDVEEFSAIKDTIFTIRDQHLKTVKALADGHEYDLLGFLKRGVEELRSSHFVRMSQVEAALRSQSSLRDRYQEEVLSQITVIEKELSELQKIEAALIIIPKENMIGFINNVFDQANRIIAMIWTVPLKIEPLKMDDTLDYTFVVTGDNQSERELSECSEGQTEILSLSINLALRVILGHLNLPICLDETGRTMDERHKQNLILLLKKLLDDRVISQLFLISHHAAIHEAFVHSETFVVREDNIMLPSVYNQHVSIT